MGLRLNHTHKLNSLSPVEHISTVAAFREALRAGAKLVITDSANGASAMFHPDPVGCSHVQEHSFEQKVMENKERNGSYFAVENLLEARERWPDVPTCRSSACSCV